MPPQGHLAEWPDKAMFAAILLILAGGIGLLVEILRLIATVDSKPLVPGILDTYPGWLSATFAGLTLVFGVLCLRAQAMSWGLLGVASALASLAYFGLVPFLGLVALGMLIKSKMEGEETRNDGVVLHGSMWPDKALAASLLLFVAGSVILMQALLILLDKFQPVILKGMEWLVVPVDTVAALMCFVAARSIYRLKGSLLGWLAAVAGIVTFGLYALGPVLGAGAAVLLRLAAKEGEFGPGAGVVPDRATQKEAKKAARKAARARGD